MIIRMVHDRDKPYLIVSKNTIRDPKLNAATLGFLIRILALPDDWAFNIRGLAKELHLGKNTVMKHLQTLSRTGYCTKRAQRRKSGTFGCEYTIFERPELAEQQSETCPQSRDRTSPHFTSPVNGDILINELQSKRVEQPTAEGQPAASPSLRKAKGPKTPHGRLRVLYCDLYRKTLGVDRAPFSKSCAGQLRNDIARLGEDRLAACLRWLFEHPPARMKSFAYMALHTFLPEAEAALAAEERHLRLVKICRECGREQQQSGVDCLYCGAHDAFRKEAEHAL